MELSTQPSPPSSSTNHNQSLRVDFTWVKFKSSISPTSDPTQPLYIIDYSTLKKECILVSSAKTGSRIGSGILPIISINPSFKLHDRKGTIKALSRFKTSYTYLSYAFSASFNGPPVAMHWTGNSDFKTWDFVCLDPQQMPVAKFKANWWSLHKIGVIEFVWDREISEAMRDEIVVTGLTVMYCMVIRTCSILGLFGALAARPGPIKEGSKEGSKQQDSSVTSTDQARVGKQD
ncbi:MAG: hypothetical protein Q9174_002277 [Haloplaca sp. 1 TL-2023]